MHYFIYPTKDATIYSGSVGGGSIVKHKINTGLDAILEIDKRTQPDYLEDSWSRILLQFDLSSWTTHSNEYYYLNLYDAGTEEVPISNTLYCYAVSQSWSMGAGTLNDYPSTLDGVSWTYRDAAETSDLWATRGGTWYSGLTYPVGSVASQSFEYSSDDIRMNVTSIVGDWLDGTIDNDGFIIKRSNADEGDKKNYGIMKYFSMDTNTVYSPKLDIAWDDSTWSTGSLAALNVTGSDYVLYMKGLVDEYNEKGKVRFRVVGRERFPEKVFSNTSEYAAISYLPSGSSYYSVRDAYTDETLFPFDEFTKLSCDSSGNYFDLWMDSFQPERYYKIVYKIVQSNGLERYFDDDFSFKVVR